MVPTKVPTAEHRLSFPTSAFSVPLKRLTFINTSDFLRPGTSVCPRDSWDRKCRRKLLGLIKGFLWLHDPSSLKTGVEEDGQRNSLVLAEAVFPLHLHLPTCYMHLPECHWYSYALCGRSHLDINRLFCILLRVLHLTFTLTQWVYSKYVLYLCLPYLFLHSSLSMLLL